MGEKIVLHAGNMGAKQGLENVIEAARLSDRAGAPVTFVLMGDGAERRRLEELAQGIRSIKFVPTVSSEHFPFALRAADALLVNERRGVAEMALPSKLTSYFSARRPVIAAVDPKGITAMEVRAANAGVVVPAGVPQTLLDAALELCNDPDRALQLGKNGLEYQGSVLSESSAIERFARLIALLERHESSDRPEAS